MARLAASTVLATAATALSLFLLAGVGAPNSGLAHLVAAVVPIPDTAALDFNQAFLTARAAPDDVRRDLLKAAEDAAAAETRAAPLRPDGWLRLAEARAVSAAGPRPDALSALSSSFDAAPMDASVGPARLRFALEAWPALSDDLRRRTLVEAETLFSTAGDGRHPGVRAALEAAVRGVRDPQGRAAGEAALVGAGAQPSAPDLAGPSGGTVR